MEPAWPLTAAVLSAPSPASHAGGFPIASSHPVGCVGPAGWAGPRMHTGADGSIDLNCQEVAAFFQRTSKHKNYFTVTLLNQHQIFLSRGMCRARKPQDEGESMSISHIHSFRNSPQLRLRMQTVPCLFFACAPSIAVSSKSNLHPLTSVLNPFGL